MELFEEIRREYEFGAGSIQGVARKLGVHRRLVREALSSAVPVRKPAPKRKRPRVGPVMDFIDAILEEDRKAPRKQRAHGPSNLRPPLPGAAKLGGIGVQCP